MLFVLKSVQAFSAYMYELVVKLADDECFRCYRDSSQSEPDTRRPVKLRELRRLSDQSRFRRRGPPFHPRFFRPPGAAPGARPGLGGDAMRWLRPRLGPVPPGTAPRGGPAMGPRGYRGPASQRPPAQHANMMMMRPPTPGQVRLYSNHTC